MRAHAVRQGCMEIPSIASTLRLVVTVVLEGDITNFKPKGADKGDQYAIVNAAAVGYGQVVVYVALYLKLIGYKQLEERASENRVAFRIVVDVS